MTFGVHKDLHNHSDGEPITIIATTIWLIYPVGENLIVVINFLGDIVLPDTCKPYDCSCEGSSPLKDFIQKQSYLINKLKAA